MGFRRKVDYTGRITLPSELCKKFDIKKDDMVDVTNNEKYILIKKNHGISEEGIVGDSIKESDKLIYEHFKDQLTENLSI